MCGFAQWCACIGVVVGWCAAVDMYGVLAAAVVAVGGSFASLAALLLVAAVAWLRPALREATEPISEFVGFQLVGPPLASDPATPEVQPGSASPLEALVPLGAPAASPPSSAEDEPDDEGPRGPP